MADTAVQTVPVPPRGTLLVDPKTGAISEPWLRYLLSIQTAVNTDVAPIDAEYWVSTSNSFLTNERNLGALNSGYLKIAVALGTANPTSVALIPAADLKPGGTLPVLNGMNLTNVTASSVSGIVPLVYGGTGADLSATGGASQVLKQVSSGATVTVGQLASTDISGIVSSTYTPTLFNVANLDASTAYACQYLRVGSIVTVSGHVDVDPTLTATATQLGLSLPVASTLAAIGNVAGTAACPTIAAQSAAVVGDVVNARAEMRWIAGDITNQPMYFSFTYQVI